MEEIKNYINAFISERDDSGDSRYYSFDYCYNYFHTFFKSGKVKELSNELNLQNSCLSLGYYLASWGMLRGSSFLLKKYSVKVYVPLIKEVSTNSKFYELWELNLDNYTSDNINLLLECKNIVKEKLGLENKPSDTLVSKIMLGIFGCVPAFDQFFRKGLNVTGFNLKSLKRISEFYNKKNFSKLPIIYTLDFNTNQFSNIKYPSAKLLDMYGFKKGQNMFNIEKK
jgi:hypothetical protein